MRKIKHVVAVLIRCAVLLVPAIATAAWLHASHGWPVSVLAALGVELIIGVVITFGTAVAAQIKAQREIKKEKSEENAD